MTLPCMAGPAGSRALKLESEAGRKAREGGGILGGMMLLSRFYRVAKVFLAASALSVLAACGGGLSVGYGWYDQYPNDLYPPQVTIDTSAAYAPAGGYVDFIAAAADESGIYDLIFYRLDGGAAVALGRTYAASARITVAVPADGRTSLSVFAEAADNAGRVGQSRVLTLAVR